MALVLSATFAQPLIDTFFTNPDQMNMLAQKSDALILEGVGSTVNLPSFQKEDITQIVRKFERPPHAPNAAGNLYIQAPFQFPAKL